MKVEKSVALKEQQKRNFFISFLIASRAVFRGQNIKKGNMLNYGNRVAKIVTNTGYLYLKKYQ